MLTLLLAVAVSASAAPVRLALIEDSPAAATTAVLPALERALRDAGGDAELLGVDMVGCSFTGDDHICRLPSALGAPRTDEASTAVALESEHGVAFVYPPAGDFVAALVKAAADPTTSYRYGAMTLREREADASAHVSAGTTILTVTAELDRPSTRRWRTGIAGFYRVRWKGRDMAVLIPGREHGGLDRLAAAAAEAPRPWIGVARGGTLGSAMSDAGPRAVLDALERIGLRWSSVGVSEIEHWTDLEAYRRERPDGVRFLSANLVNSTSAAAGPFPPYAVVDASGTRVALVGVTPDSAGGALLRAGLKSLTVRDPMAAVDALIPRLRAEADVVVLLAEPETARSARLATAGVDLILGEGPDGFSTVAPPVVVASQAERPAYAPPFPPLRAYRPALNLYEVDRRAEAGDDRASWTVTGRARMLEDTLLPLEGFPARSWDAFAASASTEAPLIPSARSVFAGPERRWPFYTAREFWTLSAGLLAEKGRAEAGLLPATRLMADAPGGLRESLVRLDLGADDAAVLVSVSGAKLKGLAAEAAEQKRREEANLPVDVKLRFAVSGFDDKGRLRGAPLDAKGVYRVATSRTAAETLDLPGPYELVAGTPTVAAAVLGELKARSPGARAADWRAWMSGAPLSEPGLWRLNFRDVGLNIRQTKVVRSNDFDPVPNSRIQGFNELLIGGVFKTDAEYLKRDLKWTNTVEAEYAKSRIEPRNAPATVNLAANRLMLLTLGTHRAGKIRQEWFARSWGPSAGLQYDGEFEAAPGLKRRQSYSLFPGVEFFDGTFIRSLVLAGVVKRDLGREPPNTQTGLRLRSVFSREIGPAKALLQGELWNNYFFLTKQDTAGDLRVEGDFNVKLRVPLRRHLSVAPFFDFYWFQLKTRPTWGHTTTLGVSIGFSRLWKPQYEAF